MPKCQVCDDLGVITHEVPVGHPDFGKTFPCPACSIYEERRQRSIVQMSHLEAHGEKTFQTFLPRVPHFSEAENAQLRAALSRCMNFANHPSNWLLLHGPCGTGKTHLAAAIGHECVKKGIRAIFVTVPDLLDHLRSSYAPYSAISYDQQFEMLTQVPMLILDDLGAESPTSWAQEKLYQLINTRYTAKLPTIITTNADLGTFDERIASRITDVHLVEQIFLNVPDFRRESSILTDPYLKDLSSLSLHKDKTLESFQLEYLSKKSRQSVEKAIEQIRKSEGWVLITGGNGSGKTHLAAALVHLWIGQGLGEGLLISTADLLDFLRSSFAAGAESSLDARFKAIRRIGLLVLDDFSLSGRTPEWSREKLYQLVDFRYTAKLPTIITLKPWRLAYLENQEPDFFSRFMDRRLVRWVFLDGGDYRTRFNYMDPNAEDHLKLIRKPTEADDQNQTEF